HLGDFGLGHGDLVALLHEPPPKPIVSSASTRVASLAKPLPLPSKWPSSAAATESGVHMPVGEPCSAAWKTVLSLGASITAAIPPCTTNTSPLIWSAAGLAR